MRLVRVSMFVDTAEQRSPKKQPALHSLARSSYAVAARTADTAAAAAAAAARAEETAEDTHIADQPCGRS